MATFTSFSSFDYKTVHFPDASGVVVDANYFYWSDSFLNWSMLGTGFQSLSIGNNSGTATSIDAYIADEHYFRLTGISLNLSTDYSDVSFITREGVTFHGTAAFSAALLSGDDIVKGSGFADRLSGFDGDDEVYGLGGSDWLEGGAGDDFIAGGAGNDTIHGGQGWDMADYGSATRAVAVDLSLPSNQATGAAGTDQLISIEDVRGSNYADTLTGNSADNSIRGMGGNDTIDGGAGWDTADYKNASGAVIVNLSLAVDQATGADGKDQLTNIESVRGSIFDDTLTGNSSDNGFRGMQGNDTIDGGAGWDFADYRNASAAVTVNLSLGTDQAKGADGFDQLKNIEEVRGSHYNDTLTGNSGDNWLRGIGGNDKLNGGSGWDYADYKNAIGAVAVNLTTNRASGSDGNDVLSNIEAVRGSNFNDVLTGNNGDNGFRGLNGNDTIDGGAGGDHVDYRNASGAVTVNLSLTTQQDTRSEGFDLLIGIEEVRGSNFNDALTGNSGNNWLRGNLGNDTLKGGSGWDTADYQNASGSVIVNLSLTSKQVTGADDVDTLSSIEGVRGSHYADKVTGNSSANWINGNLGKDVLTGGGGSDQFIFDTAYGSTNIDTITDFTTGTDKIVLDDDIFIQLGIIGTSAGAALTTAKFQLGAVANDTADRVIYNKTTGALYYDADGSGTSFAQVQVALIGTTSHATIVATDFLIVA